MSDCTFGSTFNCDQGGISCSDGQDLNECTGDLISDTNVDPGIGLCSEPGPCSINISGQNYEYTPDYSNLMSYYGNRDHFSDEQLDVMLAVLLDEDTNLKN